MPESTSASGSDGTGVRLPKINMPTFDGSIVHWKQIWDQFNVAVHSKTSLSDAEKTLLRMELLGMRSKGCPIVQRGHRVPQVPL